MKWLSLKEDQSRNGPHWMVILSFYLAVCGIITAARYFTGPFATSFLFFSLPVAYITPILALLLDGIALFRRWRPTRKTGELELVITSIVLASISLVSMLWAFFFPITY